MKVAHVVFQFGKDIVGGAEYYVYMLSKELVKQGVNIDIITSKSSKVIPNSQYGISWKNTLKLNYEIYDGLNVYRCQTIPLPRPIGLALSFLIDRQMNDEAKVKTLDGFIITTNILGNGWYYLEKWNDAIPRVRWTKKIAEFLLHEPNISKIGLIAYCPQPIKGSFFGNGKLLGKFSLGAEEWETLEYSIDNVNDMNKVLCRIELSKTWKPKKDNRRLGILVSEIYYELKNGARKQMDLKYDLDYFIRNVEPNFLFDYYKDKALRRPRIYDYMHMIAKGPLSIKLPCYLKKHAKDYDVLMGNMVPFNTINYVVWAGKKTRTPVVLLPLFHAGDKIHYWRYFFDAFRKADVVLTLSEYNRDLFRSFHINSETIGAGIDLNEFSNLSISGKHFRLRYNLEDTFVVLFVGRKTQYKRYDMVIDAVNMLESKNINTKLIMIGPDEDKEAINSKNVIYLGKVDRKIVLDAYDACDVFAMPSEYESFGMVFCEAWARKKPVIGNRRCGPVSRLINHEVDGFLCSDAKELSEYIQILARDKYLRKKVGEYGYKKVINNYTWDVVANRVKNIYEELVYKGYNK